MKKIKKINSSISGITIGFVLIILCIIIGYHKQYEDKEQSKPAIIDFSGSSDYWFCNLNIFADYNSVLFIQPMRDDFTFPLTITVSVLYDQNILSETLIQHIPDQNNPKSLGHFEGKIDSEELTTLTHDILNDHKDNPESLELWRSYRNRVSIKIQYDEKEFFTPVELNSVRLQ